ncbi:MAG TPA: FHA domain-containing protein [Kofleriaceae bacterium]|jgi:predicted component of type VI protein secretion system
MGSVTGRATDGALAWCIDDEVVRLRLRGDTRAFGLPLEAHEWTIGSAKGCELILRDPSNTVSRRHAQLVRDGAAWRVRDLGSTNGIREGAELRKSVVLAPGVELSIGSIVLVAESERLAQLRGFLARAIGFGDAAGAAVDDALRATRAFANGAAALVLAGAGDLSRVAQRLHAIAVGEKPFVAHAGAGAAAELLARARTGTLCLAAERLPASAGRAAFEVDAAPARLVAWAATRDLAAPIAARAGRIETIELPPLRARSAAERDRIIDEYAADAATTLEAPAPNLRALDHQWLRAVELDSLAQIEQLALRLVALRNWGVTAGGARLGITHVALSRWARRRGIPT